MFRALGKKMRLHIHVEIIFVSIFDKHFYHIFFSDSVRVDGGQQLVHHHGGLRGSSEPVEPHILHALLSRYHGNLAI